jgi:Tfp pilus assembly protein PilO
MEKVEGEEQNMKNFLVAVIAFAIIVMPYTYYYIPSLNQTNNMRQEITNLKASLARFENGREALYRELLASQKENLEKENKRLNYLLPAFATARANLMAPFDTLREEIPGDWNVVPEGKFKNSGPLVFWPFNFRYTGKSEDAVKVLAYMEVNTQFMRLDNYKFETNDKLVTLSGKVELVFQEKLMEEGGKK